MGRCDGPVRRAGAKGRCGGKRLVWRGLGAITCPVGRGPRVRAWHLSYARGFLSASQICPSASPDDDLTAWKGAGLFCLRHHVASGPGRCSNHGRDCPIGPEQGRNRAGNRPEQGCTGRVGPDSGPEDSRIAAGIGMETDRVVSEGAGPLAGGAVRRQVRRVGCSPAARLMSCVPVSGRERLSGYSGQGQYSRHCASAGPVVAVALARIPVKPAARRHWLRAR